MGGKITLDSRLRGNDKKTSYNFCLLAAVVAEIVNSDEKFPHHNHPEITAPRRQVQMGRKIAESPGDFKGGNFLPHGFQKFAFIFLLHGFDIEFCTEQLHHKIIAHLIAKIKPAGCLQGQFAALQRGDVFFDIERIGITGPMHVADGAAA